MPLDDFGAEISRQAQSLANYVQPIMNQRLNMANEMIMNEIGRRIKLEDAINIKKREMELENQMINERFRNMGNLFGGMDTGTPAFLSSNRSMQPIVPVREPMMSLIGGGEGDILGNPLQTIQGQGNIVPIDSIPQTVLRKTLSVNAEGMPTLSFREEINPAFRKQEQIDREKRMITRAKEFSKEKQLLAARKNLDSYSSDALQVLNAIDKVENVAKKLPISTDKDDRGFWGQSFKRGHAFVRKIGRGKEETQYLGTVAQELIPLARKLMEEKGPITEFDVKRVEQGLGDLTLPWEDRVFLFNQMRDKIRKAVTNKLQVSEITEDEFKEKYKELFKALNESGSSGNINYLKSKYGLK